MRRALAIVVLAAGCSKGQPPPLENQKAPPPADASVAPTEAECDQLLAHLVDLEFAHASGTASTAQMKHDVAKQRAAVIETKRDEFQQECRTLTRERVACALAASDSTAVGKCDE
jgi:hypothetical protein